MKQKIIEDMRVKLMDAIQAVQAYLAKEGSIPMLEEILKCLEGMEQSLRGQDQISEGYRNGLFGVYRMLSDSGPLESSPIGQVLVDLQGDLHELSKRL